MGKLFGATFKVTSLVTLALFFLTGCALTKGSMSCKSETITHKIEISVAADSPQAVAIEGAEDKINKTMQIPNQRGTLSPLSFIIEDEAFIKIFSALSVGDVTNLWNDICVLTKSTKIRNINLFINSPGGDAFSGLALADQLERAKADGFHIIAHASGIVASAAVPVFAVCNERLAAPGTIFMVHETSLWKWPGRETASDIRSQNRLMTLLRERYIGKLAKYSKLDRAEWEELEYKTTWFSAEKAKSYGLVDKIE